MLSLKDFTEKKLVYLSNYEKDPNDLKFHNSNLRLYKKDKFVNQISCHLIFSVFIVGETTLTSHLIRKAQEYGFSIFLLNYSLHIYASILSTADGNYKLREKQYKSSDDFALELSKKLVHNKIRNQLSLSNKYKIRLNEGEYLSHIENAHSNEKLLGLEGSFAASYFKKVFSDIGWYRRAPRTKEDIPNLLLDIGYSFLFNYIDSLLNLFGFDTYKGYYHRLFFQRKSLSCDIMEPLRPIIDNQLIKAYHLRQVDAKDFVFQNGAYSFKKGVSGKYTSIWLECIMKNRDEIYKYVLGFYRYVMDSDNIFPTFRYR